MSVDTAAMRRKIERSYHILRGSITGNLEYVTPKDALEMVEEIERLRLRCETAERAAARYKADFLKAYAEDEKRWQMHGADAAGAEREESEG